MYPRIKDYRRSSFAKPKDIISTSTSKTFEIHIKFLLTIPQRKIPTLHMVVRYSGSMNNERRDFRCLSFSDNHFTVAFKVSTAYGQQTHSPRPNHVGIIFRIERCDWIRLSKNLRCDWIKQGFPPGIPS